MQISPAATTSLHVSQSTHLGLAQDLPPAWCIPLDSGSVSTVRTRASGAGEVQRNTDQGGCDVPTCMYLYMDAAM